MEKYAARRCYGTVITSCGQQPGTVTNTNGEYTLRAANAVSALLLSFTGVARITEPIKGRSNIRIAVFSLLFLVLRHLSQTSCRSAEVEKCGNCCFAISFCNYLYHVKRLICVAFPTFGEVTIYSGKFLPLSDS